MTGEGNAAPDDAGGKYVGPERREHPGHVVYSRGPLVYGLVVLSGVCGLVAIAAMVFSYVKIHEEINDRIASVEKSREYSAGITCAVVSAVTEGGRAVIVGSGSAPGSKEFIANLRRLGYRPPSVRQQEAIADAYVRSITESVEQQAGGKNVRNLVDRNGALNCVRFKALAVSQP